MGTRVLSLWLPYLAIDRMRREQDGLALIRKNLPRATCLDGDGDHPLVALCPKAEQAGLAIGMNRAEALRRVPGLLTSLADPDADERFLQTCVSWCERFTPFVAVDKSVPSPSDKGASLWLDIGSSAHLAGGEASLLAGLLGRFRKEGVLAKAAIADHPGSAWAACRFGGDEQRILPAKGGRVALASWPVDALRLSDASCESLRSAGLDRIEHLYALPRRALAARFGDHTATRLDQALGLVDEPIATDTPLPAQQAQMIFAEPIIEAAAIKTLVERLVHQLCIGLEAAGLGAKRLTLALYRVDNSTVTCSIGTDRPSRDKQGLTEQINDRLLGLDLGFGLERAILDAVEIEPMISETVQWRGLGTAADEELPDLARYRQHQARREKQPAHFDEWHAPNRAPLGRRHLPLFLQSQGGEARIGAVVGAATALAVSPDPVQRPVLQESLPRPLRLLRQPEPIEAIASLPHEPPVLFRWRQRLHKVISARGPETVAPNWWHQPEMGKRHLSGKENTATKSDERARDYFAVEDSDGALFWLFRDGCDGATERSLPRWFLHGVFG